MGTGSAIGNRSWIGTGWIGMFARWARLDKGSNRMVNSRIEKLKAAMKAKTCLSCTLIKRPDES